MKTKLARAKRADQPPSTPGTSPRRARLRPVTVALVAIGLVAVAAQVVSAQPGSAPVRTTGSAAGASPARPAEPVRLAKANTAFAKIGTQAQKAADVRKWELALKFDILRRHHTAELYRRMKAHAAAEKARRAAAAAAKARAAQAASSHGSCGGSLPPCWVMRRESGGNIRAKNPSSSASGKWQFIRSTWAGFGGYAEAWQAPESVQDAKARQLWAGGRGCGHWGAC